MHDLRDAPCRLQHTCLSIKPHRCDVARLNELFLVAHACRLRRTLVLDRTSTRPSILHGVPAAAAANDQGSEPPLAGSTSTNAGSTSTNWSHLAVAWQRYTALRARHLRSTALSVGKVELDIEIGSRLKNKEIIPTESAQTSWYDFPGDREHPVVCAFKERTLAVRLYDGLLCVNLHMYTQDVKGQVFCSASLPRSLLYEMCHLLQQLSGRALTRRPDTLSAERQMEKEL